MELQFEIPRSTRPRLLFIAAVLLAMALWPALQRVMGMVSPQLTPESESGGTKWDLRSM
jgi:hypothetical protein